ncbi:predicted protein [Nematostella vectensis]|uniref:Uncharacterized protein n=1 Tax=Nematostella vectensis TaxID=45351 RepID=A7SAK0_NEMVE|nr:uncharacterized protein LOC5510958 [Nematostella vectensis]XP_048582522.1 uncharacterized protein LOC5510958 [Nematostella vectensis]EDO39322.1 predicted protein [Nematostella vectensis]|eukprot:XP_001631385.1 predicted protein [Nematostella vectensis]
MAEVMNLGDFKLSARKLRFLQVESSSRISFNKELTGEHMPLFLGADVLYDCPITIANLPRTHARFAKRGLATKITFPASQRVIGIHGTSKGVWFYSIQGLFRVVFEYYNREDQLDVIEHLQNVLKLRISDSLLKEEIDLSYALTLFDERDLKAHGNSEVCFQEAGSDRENSSPSSHSNSASENNNSASSQINALDHNIRKCDSLFQELNSYLCKYQSDCSESNDLNAKQKLLCKLCKLIGREFNNAKPDIEAKVTQFKAKHILTIHSLPCAEEVVEELFPLYMRDLMWVWMGGEEQAARTPNSSLYPLMQLILEFANQTLVSGVAHVLYSRLLRSDRV